MKKHAPHILPNGALLQSGMHKRSAPEHIASAGGLELRAAVLKTHRGTELDLGGETTVFCDVLVYSGLEGARIAPMYRVPVLQDSAGLHDGSIWVPRAATLRMNLPLNLAGVNPADLDCDHVIVGFLDDDLWTPVVKRGAQHPRADKGNEARALGHRLTPKAGDDDVRYQKFHGTYYGIDGRGSFRIDTTRSHDGVYTSSGEEPAVPTEGAKGGVGVCLGRDGSFHIEVESDDDQARSYVQISANGTIFMFPASGSVDINVNGTSISIEDGKVTILDPTGEVEIDVKNATIGKDYSVDQIPDGKTDIRSKEVLLGDGADKGVARRDDSTIVDGSTDAALFTWMNAVVTSLTGLNASPGPAPTSIVGKITGASTWVKAKG